MATYISEETDRPVTIVCRYSEPSRSLGYDEDLGFTYKIDHGPACEEV